MTDQNAWALAHLKNTNEAIRDLCHERTQIKRPLKDDGHCRWIDLTERINALRKQKRELEKSISWNVSVAVDLNL